MCEQKEKPRRTIFSHSRRFSCPAANARCPNFGKLSLGIHWQTVVQFSELLRHLPLDKPIFVKGCVYNSTVNDILKRHCERSGIPVISIHGLRHTHASILLFAGVTIASVARRLGYASMTTTQKIYLHIIQELENQDVDLVIRSISGL